MALLCKVIVWMFNSWLSCWSQPLFVTILFSLTIKQLWYHNVYLQQSQQKSRRQNSIWPKSSESECLRSFSCCFQLQRREKRFFAFQCLASKSSLTIQSAKENNKWSCAAMEQSAKLNANGKFNGIQKRMANKFHVHWCYLPCFTF